MPKPTPEEDAALLIEVEGRLIADDVIADLALRTGDEARRPLDHAALWRHANRRSSDPVDFAVARRLREDPAARRLLATMIASAALACSPMAYAAADASALTRKVGDYTVELQPAGDGGIAALVIEVPPGAGAPTLLRAEWEGRSAVLDLPEPQEGLVELFFPPDTAAEVIAILREPTALIALE